MKNFKELEKNELKEVKGGGQHWYYRDNGNRREQVGANGEVMAYTLYTEGHSTSYLM